MKSDDLTNKIESFKKHVADLEGLADEKIAALPEGEARKLLVTLKDEAKGGAQLDPAKLAKLREIIKPQPEGK